MIITHYGAEFFKVSFGDTTLAFNPVSKSSKQKQNKFGADIALISLEHPDMNGAKQVKHGDHDPVVVRGPGEYEIHDVLIKGYQTKSTYGGEELINTAYLVTMEKMLLLFLGATDTATLPGEIKEVLDRIDILFVPIGGEGVLEPGAAHELAVSIGPKIVVPMHYGTLGAKDSLATFLKEEGGENNHKPIDKLTVRARDLEGKENEVVIFSH